MLVKGGTGEMGPSSLHRQVISNNVYDWMDIYLHSSHKHKHSSLTGYHLITIDHGII